MRPSGRAAEGLADQLRAALVAYATERGTKVPELLLAELEKHAGGTAFGDDVTMLAFELTEAAG